MKSNVGGAASKTRRKRCVSSVEPKLEVRDSSVAAAIFADCFVGLGPEREELWALTLGDGDEAGELLWLGGGEERIRIVSTTVLLPVLLTGRLSFVLAHNHPSGDPKPSLSDWTSTAALIEAADSYGLELVDHLVLGGGRYVSMRGRNAAMFEEP